MRESRWPFVGSCLESFTGAHASSGSAKTASSWPAN